MKLIDKDALVAEIKKLHGNPFYRMAIKDVLSILDTLEAKEVDLDREYKEFICCDNGRSMQETAKHFFELGLRSTITEEDCKLIWTIGDEIPNMPEEEFFKELLRRYKAQKGE